MGIYTTHFCRYGYNPVLTQLMGISEAEFQKLMPKGYEKPKLVKLPIAQSQDQLKGQKKHRLPKLKLKTLQDHMQLRFQTRAQSDPLAVAVPTDASSSPDISHQRRFSEFNGLSAPPLAY
jgi:hypothetical protein